MKIAALNGLLIALFVSGLMAGIILLFTKLWWIGCILDFLYMWAVITFYLYDAQKEKE